MTPAAKHVIITGGSSGIGEAFAKAYLARGSSVSILARRPERLASARSRLVDGRPEMASRLQGFPADVCDRSMLAEAFRQAQDAFGPCDRLITCAGIARPGAFTELDDSHFREQMDVNFFGTLNAIRCVYSHMARRGDGRILLVASGAALVGIHGYTAYSASKFAVVGLAETLQAEARKAGVGVSVCFPPDTDTPQLAEEARHKTAEAVAVSRLGGLWSADAVARHATRRFEQGRFNIFLGKGITALGFFGSLIRPALRLEKWG